MAYDREKGDDPSDGEAAYRVIRDRESWNADAKVCWGIRKTAPEEALARCSTGFPSQTRDGFIDGVRCRALHALRVLRLRLEFAGEYPMSGSHRKGVCPEP